MERVTSVARIVWVASSHFQPSACTSCMEDASSLKRVRPHEVTVCFPLLGTPFDCKEESEAHDGFPLITEMNQPFIEEFGINADEPPQDAIKTSTLPGIGVVQRFESMKRNCPAVDRIQSHSMAKPKAASLALFCKEARLLAMSLGCLTFSQAPT